MSIRPTQAQFAEIIPNAADLQESDIKPYMDDAELWLKREYLGTPLYNTIDADQVTYADVVVACQKVIAVKGYYEGVPELDVIQTANGLGVVSNTNVAPASKDRVANLRAQLQKRYNQKLEDLFDILEETTALHTDWKGSETFSLLYDVLVPTFRTFNRIVKIENREVFLQLHNFQVAVQDEILADQVSRDYLDQLIEWQKDADVSLNLTANSKVMKFLQNACAMMAVSKAIGPMSITLSDDGVLRKYEIGKSSFASEERIKDVKADFFRQGKESMNMAIRTMEATLTDYPLYANSTEYANKQNLGFQNTADNTIFDFGG